MSAKEDLNAIAKKIDNEVLKVFERELGKSSSISPAIKDVLNNAKPLVANGGKRIRGAFFYYSYLMHGGKSLKEALIATSFIELIHAYLLVHDDIMDESQKRRGHPTLHTTYEKIYRLANPRHYTNGTLRHKAEHFGESMAINIGDVLCHMGLQVLTDSKFENDLKIKAMSKLHRSITDTGYGQIVDVYGDIENVDEEYVLKVHLYKTGYYTYQTPLHIGAILAGATEKDLDALTKYAIPAGIAFQIQDDIIDLFSDETGKTPGLDIMEGKRTLLIVKAYENATRKDKIILDNALGNKNLTSDTFEAVKKILIDTGSLEYSITKAAKLLKKSTKDFTKAKRFENAGSDFLIGINDYMLNRKF